jgi:hypothetical protein
VPIHSEFKRSYDFLAYCLSSSFFFAIYSIPPGKLSGGIRMRNHTASTVAWALLLLILSQVATLAIDDPSYELSPWPYGAIAWVGGLPDNAQTMSAILTQAVEDVFTLWELSVPSPMEGWEDPANNESAWKTGKTTGAIPQVVKKNPATNQLWRLNPLSWEGIEAYSMLFIAFPTRTLLAQAFGNTAHSGVWIRGGAAIAGSAVWYQSITSVPMSITAPITDGMLTIWHEFGHWMTYLVCSRDNTVMSSSLPSLLKEGIAEYTESYFVGLSGRKSYAAAWAKENSLSIELDIYNTYRIGASIVAYLVETHGPTEFLASLSSWAENPEDEIAQMEAGWREWLGLPRRNPGANRVLR